jgi:outer membrane receptor protein involved in Fe transport
MKAFVTLVLVFVGICCLAQEPTKEEKKENPLIVIDGIKYLRSDSTNALKKLNPEKIKEIKVLRGQDAINLYGEDGKSGVILVTTKANLANKPLFLLDGERVDDLASIDPNSIQSIEVIKDPAKLQPYGDEGSAGVVKITSKRKGLLE